MLKLVVSSEAIVTVSVFALVVIVTFVPPANFNVSSFESATILLWPDTATFLNIFCVF